MKLKLKAEAKIKFNDLLKTLSEGSSEVKNQKEIIQNIQILLKSREPKEPKEPKESKELRETFDPFELSHEQIMALANLLAVGNQNPQVLSILNNCLEYNSYPVPSQEAIDKYNLGRHYKHTEKNPSLAFKFYAESAALNYPPSQNALGLCYDFGTGCEKDPKKAVELYSLAANCGNPNGLYDLGLCLELGAGIEQNKNKAIELYVAASMQSGRESDAARLMLGKYFEEQCKDLNKAESLYLLALYDDGYSSVRKSALNSLFNLALTYEHLNDKKAAYLFNLLAAKSHYKTLGYCFENGIGREKDIYQVIRHYTKALEEGDDVEPYFSECIQKIEQSIKISTDAKIKLNALLKTLSEKRPENKMKEELIQTLKTLLNKDNEITPTVDKIVTLGNLLTVASLYRYGLGTEKDVKLSDEILNSLAQFIVYKKQELITDIRNVERYERGMNYINGRNGFSKDEEKGIKEIELAAIGSFAFGFGHPLAQNFMGSHYMEHPTQKNPKLAFHYLKLAADQGEHFSQNQIGLFYDKGFGCDKNPKKEIAYYALAAHSGNSPAQDNLANCFELGSGISKNYKKAEEFSILSAIQGYHYALLKLGSDYEIKKDLIKAEALYRLNLERCGESNKVTIDKLFNIALIYADYDSKASNLKIEKNEKKAAELFAFLSEKGHSTSQNWMGHYYRLGIGVNKNETKAFELYNLAIRNGDFHSCIGLGLCFESGIGCAKNLNEAIKMFKKARDAGLKEAESHLKRCLEKPKMLWDCIENGKPIPNFKEFSKAMPEIVNIECPDSGLTALQRAVLKNDWEKATVLIEHGASIHSKNRVGLTAFDIAKKQWRGEAVSLPGGPKLCL